MLKFEIVTRLEYKKKIIYIFSACRFAMEDPARFAAVLNGVVKRTFDNEEQITPSFIKEQVFPQHDISVEGT